MWDLLRRPTSTKCDCVRVEVEARANDLRVNERVGALQANSSARQRVQQPRAHIDRVLHADHRVLEATTGKRGGKGHHCFNQ